MITADEARKLSKPVFARLEKERRKDLIQRIDRAMVEAADKGEGRANISVDCRDVEFIRQEVMKAGYEVAGTYDGIVIRWMGEGF